MTSVLMGRACQREISPIGPHPRGCGLPLACLALQKSQSIELAPCSRIPRVELDADATPARRPRSALDCLTQTPSRLLGESRGLGDRVPKQWVAAHLASIACRLDPSTQI